MWIGRYSPNLPDGVTYIPERWERWLSPLEALPHAADWRHRGSIARLRSISKDQFDLVHLHNIYGGWLSMRSVQELTERMPCVWTLHDEWAPNRGLTSNLTGKMTQAEVKALSRGALRYAPYDRYHENFRWRSMRRLLDQWMPRPRIVVCPSAYMTEKSRASGVFPRSTVLHVPNGSTMPEVANARMDRAEARRSFGLSSGAGVVLMAAADLSEAHKGIHLAIRALKGIEPELNVQALLLGRSAEGVEEALRPLRCVSAYASDDEMLARAYRAADLTIIPSLAENFPYVGLESLACETPLVASPVGGMPEMVGKNERGRVCAAIDAEEMSRHIAELLGRRELREALGASGAAWVRERCGMDAYLVRMKEVYRQAVGCEAIG